MSRRLGCGSCLHRLTTLHPQRYEIGHWPAMGRFTDMARPRVGRRGRHEPIGSVNDGRKRTPLRRLKVDHPAGCHGRSSVGLEGSAEDLALQAVRVALEGDDVGAVDEAVDHGGDGIVNVGRLDLADQASVVAFVASWSGPLDRLINNARVKALPDLHLTPEGIGDAVRDQPSGSVRPCGRTARRIAGGQRPLRVPLPFLLPVRGVGLDRRGCQGCVAALTSDCSAPARVVRSRPCPCQSRTSRVASSARVGRSPPGPCRQSPGGLAWVQGPCLADLRDQVQRRRRCVRASRR